MNRYYKFKVPESTIFRMILSESLIKNGFCKCILDKKKFVMIDLETTQIQYFFNKNYFLNSELKEINLIKLFYYISKRYKYE